MIRTPKRRPSISVLVLAIAAALGLGSFAGWFEARKAVAAQAASEVPVTGTEDTYVCPMHRDIVDHQPGTCPICGMALVKGHAVHAHGADAHELSVDGAELSGLGVNLVAVHKRQIDLDMRTYGTVVPDETTLYSVQPKFDGWVKTIRLHSVGERVEKGQVVYEIYSPDLVMKEREYFKFLSRRKQILQAVGDVSQQENEYVMDLLRESQKEREEFLRLDLGVETVRQLEDSGTTIEVVKVLAQRSGVVTQLNAREGSYVSPAAPVFTIADASTLWVDVALYPDQSNRLQPGDPVSISVGGGQPIEARLDFVNPLAEGGRGRARVVLRQAQLQGRADLHFGSLVDVTIHAQPHQALVLPSSAVARTGHGNFVMLARQQGRFLPVEVRPGIEAGDEIEILGGLREGAPVASNAQLLLDSAASLSDTRERRQPSTGTSL
jgi:Cu(I)/Ag(I) efflux system membrane fusion protein